jgi:murein DD-endopeptidase MepM/ murein hydrolase activator NlpD
MACFPLRQVPQESWHEAPRKFGNAREQNAREHAGCDLYAPYGTEVLAIENGTVVRAPYKFYADTYAVEIQHSFGIARYCEIDRSCTLTLGQEVKEGEVIAKIGHLRGIAVGSDMLHIEIYDGSAEGPLTEFQNKPFCRRKDLIDPTDFLDALAGLPPRVLA